MKREHNSLKSIYRIVQLTAVLFLLGAPAVYVHAEKPGEAVFELEAGAASLLSVEEVFFSQDAIKVSDAEKLYGANVEVLTEEARLWEEIEEKVGTVAIAVADHYVYVRSDADIESEAIGKAYGDTVVLITGTKESEEELWYQVESDGVKGYIRSDFLVTGEGLAALILTEEVSKAYVENPEEWENVRTKEEEEKILEVNEVVTGGDTSLIRQQIVDYSMQFLGNRYISGGTSLSGGTDCSGFTCFIYQDFGYSIDRTPAGQFHNAGRSISYSEIQPGDIICYGNGSCTHVALYIGNGQIIHSANSRKGVVIYEADYDTIMGVKRILD